MLTLRMRLLRIPELLLKMKNVEDYHIDGSDVVDIDDCDNKDIK